MSTVKPLDREAVIKAANETAAIVTVEEATVAGGMGSAVAEIVVQTPPVPMRILGIPSFAPTGPMEFIFQYFHLNPESIARGCIGYTSYSKAVNYGRSY